MSSAPPRFQLGQGDEPLTDFEKRLRDRLLRDTLDLPDDFVTYLANRIAVKEDFEIGTQNVYGLDKKLRQYATSVSAFSSGPPASPKAGDIWVATGVGPRNAYWQFMYDPSEPTYKWKFIGGPPLMDGNGMNTFQNTVDGAWENSSGVSVTVARGGYYQIRYGANAEISGTGATAYLGVGSPTSAFAPYVFLTCAVSVGGGLWTTLTGEFDIEEEADPAAGPPTTYYLVNDSSTHGLIAYENGWLAVTPVKIS